MAKKTIRAPLEQPWCPHNGLCHISKPQEGLKNLRSYPSSYLHQKVLPFQMIYWMLHHQTVVDYLYHLDYLIPQYSLAAS